MSTQLDMVPLHEFQNLSSKELKLIGQAVEKSGRNIFRIENENCSCLKESFRKIKGKLTFWYDLPNGSTTLVREDTIKDGCTDKIGA